jgi:hypothetical protein
MDIAFPELFPKNAGSYLNWNKYKILWLKNLFLPIHQRRGGKAMAYYQDIVGEYLRADRSIFINQEFAIQLDEGVAQPKKGRSWICDAVAVDFRKKAVFLCEVTYSQTLSALLGRLKSWTQNWQGVTDALYRDSCIPHCYTVRPWVFLPESLIEAFVKKYRASGAHFEPVLFR